MAEKRGEQNYLPAPAATSRIMQIPPPVLVKSAVRDEDVAKFICKLCMKSFYNENALKNHKNMSHDANEEESEGWNPFMQLEPDFSSLRSFKFIPLNPEDSEESSGKIVTRIFTRDTSYLIVKVEHCYLDNPESANKYRVADIVKKSQQNVESPVNIRGPFTCNLPSTLCPDLQCRKIFFNCCQYSLHYRSEHTKRRKSALRCQVCEKRLDCGITTEPSTVTSYQPINSTFDEHNRILNERLKPHQCAICFKRFTQQGGLQQHMRMHTGIRPFPCTYCSKAFTQKAGLDQHLRTHTKVKPFKCVICSKCFSQSVHLRQHMRTHTNIQPFECFSCGKRFKQRSHLNLHLRSHMSNSEAVFVADHLTLLRRRSEQIDFFNLSNLQPVQDGDTLYYAAEIAPDNMTTL